MFVLYAIVLVVPLFLFWLHRKQVEEDEKLGLPGPKGWPLLGMIFETMSHVKKRDMFEKLHDYHEIYGDTYLFRVGPKKMIISRDPKITEIIGNNPKFGKSRDYDFFEPWLGDGLLTSEGEKWHRMRKLLTPAFHFQNLERFIRVFEEQVAVMIEKIRKQIANPKGIDVCPMFHALTMDIISETSMGVQLNAQSGENFPFVEANQTAMETIYKRLFSGYLKVGWIFRLSSLYKVQTDCIAFINAFVDKVIKQRHEMLSKESHNQTTERESTKRPALLDILLLAQLDGKPLSNKEIQDEVKSFMFAGHETAATALSFIIYILAKLPQVQNKVWHEIKLNSLDVSSDPLTIRKLNSLSYLDNVIKETLRLYSPGTMISKCCREDIQVGQMFIPANQSIATNMYSSHRNEKYFKNAERFDPDRWDNEINAEYWNPYAYIPFSSGLRNCLGQKFAMLEMKTILVKLMSNFELELVSKDFEVDLWQLGTLQSRNGVQLKFKERSK